MLGFIVHNGVHLHRAPGTVKMRLAAIRSAHLNMGVPDPFEFMPRVSLALAGLKRRWGTKPRRQPVTPGMLRWIRAYFDTTNPRGEGTVLWAAVCLGFFFLLRASEYFDTGYRQLGRGLKGQDVQLRNQGVPVKPGDWSMADEIVLFIRGSKTDTLNRGEVRNHFATEDSTLCVTRAVAALFAAFPERYQGGSEQHFELLRLPNGKHVPRVAIQSLLIRAAQGTGERYPQMGSHSLRFGGASAIWAACGDSAQVRRWGRWSSDAFHGHLWDSREASRDVANKMSRVDLTPN